MIRWVKNGLDQGTERAMVRGSESTWWPVMPQGLILGPGLCHIFINNLENGMEYPSRFSGDTRLWEIFTVESWAAFQKYLHKLKKWPDRMLMVYNRHACKVLWMGGGTPDADQVDGQMAGKQIGRKNHDGSL